MHERSAHAQYATHGRKWQLVVRLDPAIRNCIDENKAPAEMNATEEFQEGLCCFFQETEREEKSLISQQTSKTRIRPW